MLAIERTVKRARRYLNEYKKIKCCEIEAFLFHFDMLWEGSAYLPKHVSEAMDQIQKAVALDRGVLEGYLVNTESEALT